MFGLFLVTAMTLIAAPANAELACQENGVTDAKACVEFIWDRREGVPMTQDVYNARFND